MDQLPCELIDLVCEWLTIEEMSNLSSVNKYFRQLIQQNHFYSFCRESFDSFCKESFDKNKGNYIRNLMQHFNYFCRFYVCHPKKYGENWIFEVACEGGHLEVAKWLIKILPKINIRAVSDYAFRNACANGHLETAKWLTNICSNYVITQESPEILYVIKN